MKKLLIALALSSGFALTTSASVSLSIEGGQLRTSTGTPVGDGGLIILVASTEANGFASSFDGNASTSVGTFLDADDQIIAKFSVSSLAGNGAGGFAHTISGFNYTGTLGQDDKLQLYWFPSLTTSSTTFGIGTSYGAYRSDAALDGATRAWDLPADGTSFTTITFYTQSIGGSVADSFANATLTTVPEPATTIALLGGAAGLFVIHRRRRQRKVAPTAPAA